jgi:hypothetical protein
LVVRSPRSEDQGEIFQGKQSSMERRALWRDFLRRGDLREESLQGESRSAEIMSSWRERLHGENISVERKPS